MPKDFACNSIALLNKSMEVIPSRIASYITNEEPITDTFVSTSELVTRTFYLKTTFLVDSSQESNVVNYETYYGTKSKYALILYLYLFYQLLNSQYHMVLITLY